MFPRVPPEQNKLLPFRCYRISMRALPQNDVGMLESEMAKMFFICQKCYSYTRVYCYAIIFKQRKLSHLLVHCVVAVLKRCVVVP